MEVQRAREDVLRLVGELREFRYVASAATRNAAAVSKIISGYVEMFPELGALVEADDLADQEGTDENSPKGAEAVRLILHEEPNHWFYVSDLVENLRNRGWLPDSDNPANAVRTALERLINTPDSDVKKGRKASKVVYSYRPDDFPRLPQTGPPLPTPPPSYDDEEPF